MVNPSHLPALLQTQEEERDCHRGRPPGWEGAPHGQGVPGCFGNRFKYDIFYNALILVSAEDAQTQWPPTSFHSGTTAFLWEDIFPLPLCTRIPWFHGGKKKSWFFHISSSSFSLFDSLIHFVHWKMRSIFKLYLFPFFCLFLLVLVSSRKSSLNALSARRHMRVGFLLCHASTRFRYICLEFNL